MDKGKYVEEIRKAMIREFEEKEIFTLDEGIKAIKDLYTVKDECSAVNNTIDSIINNIANKIGISTVAASIFKYKKFRDKIAIDQNKVMWYDGIERIGIASGIKSITERKVDNIEEILIEKNNGKSIRINEKAFILGWE